MAETPRKKRKTTDARQDGAGSVVTGEEAQTLIPFIRISSTLQPRSSPPVIATSPGIQLPDNVLFHSYAKPIPQTPRKRRSGDALSSQELLLHSVSHRKMNYTAKEDGPSGMSSLLKHYLCIFSPKTGDLDIVGAKKMMVRGGVRTLAAQDATEDGSPVKAHVRRRQELGEAFGTKKAKKAIAGRHQNAISTGVNTANGRLKASDAALMNIVKETAANVSSQAELQAVIDSSRLIPRGNFTADDIHDVYDPAGIIGAELLHSIPVRDWQEKHREDDSIQVPSRFVANRIAREASRPDAVQRLRILRYLIFLITFWRLTHRGRAPGVRFIGKRDQLRETLAPAPEPVIESIRRKFSEAGEMRKPQVDMLMTHCAVLACLVDSFETDMFDLREDLGLEEKEMGLYFAEIGARTEVRKADGRRVRVARLALPLQFPKLRTPRRRAR